MYRFPEFPKRRFPDKAFEKFIHTILFTFPNQILHRYTNAVYSENGFKILQHESILFLQSLPEHSRVNE